MDRKLAWLVAGALAAALALPAPAAAARRDERRWEKAGAAAQAAPDEAARIAIYEQFLAEEPQSEHAAEARAAIEAIRFEQADRAGTREAFERFLADYPESARAGDLLVRLAELDYQAAAARDTASAYAAFLAAHPDSPRAGAVRMRMAELAHQAASAAPSIAAFEAFLADYPEGPPAEAARAWIADEREWQTAAASDQPAGAAAYLERFPAGRHRTAAFDRYRRLQLADRLRPLLGAWALVDARLPPGLKRPMMFLYLDADQRAVVYVEARRMFGGDPVATSVVALVDGPPAPQQRLYDVWERRIVEIAGELEFIDRSPRFPAIESKRRYRLEGERIRSDVFIQQGKPELEEYERLALPGTPRFDELLAASRQVSAAADARHQELYRPAAGS